MKTTVGFFRHLFTPGRNLYAAVSRRITMPVQEPSRDRFWPLKVWLVDNRPYLMLIIQVWVKRRGNVETVKREYNLGIRTARV